jgi:hypothetical protein
MDSFANGWKVCSTAGALTLVAAATASAFFPPIRPVDPPITVLPNPGPAQPPPVIIPTVPPPPFIPPVTPTTTVTPNEVPGCDCDCHTPNPPNTVPEPATVVSGLIGLGLVGGAAWRRRKAKPE